MAVASKAKEKVISAESDVIAHRSRIHPDQFDGEGVNDEFHFYCNGAANDLNNSRFRKLIDQL